MWDVRRILCNVVLVSLLFITNRFYTFFWCLLTLNLKKRLGRLPPLQVNRNTTKVSVQLRSRIHAEAPARRCSIKKLFLEISLNSQENICASLFFNKVVGWGLQLFWKRLWQRCFAVNFAKISKNTFSYRTPPAAVSFHANSVFNTILRPEFLKIGEFET